MQPAAVDRLVEAAEAMGLRGQWVIRETLATGTTCEISRNGAGDGWAAVAIYDEDERTLFTHRCTSFHEMKLCIGFVSKEAREGV